MINPSQILAGVSGTSGLSESPCFSGVPYGKSRNSNSL